MDNIWALVCWAGTWYCKTYICSLCWLHFYYIAIMFPLLSICFSLIIVFVLVAHEGMELAYDAKLHMRWLLLFFAMCFFHACHQTLVSHHSAATPSCCLRWWHWMMSTGVPWQPWVLMWFFVLCSNLILHLDGSHLWFTYWDNSTLSTSWGQQNLQLLSSFSITNWFHEVLLRGRHLRCKLMVIIVM